MSRIATFAIALLCTLQLNAQKLDANSFDFWVGDWNLTWTDANGGSGKGTNKLVTILDDKVIQEHFEAHEGALSGYKGTSISVYNPQNQTWHQTWQDNQGGNIVFTGRVDGDKKYFETVLNNGNQSRMVFHSFSEEGFTWDWEATTDGGKNWTLNWQINYRKAK